jgi:hypothetical protein
MEKRVYIRPAALPKTKKRLFIALGVLFVGGVVAMQMELTFTRNAIAGARNDVESAAVTAQEGVAEAAPAQTAIDTFKESLEQTP